jgi:LEA14-like dessication related protein
MGCEALNPALALREAAGQLRFSLDRVEPRLELAWPLEQSRLQLGLVLGVENPSATRISARGLKGDLSLVYGGSTHALGRVLFPEGVNLEPKARGSLNAELSFSYTELKAVWEPLRKVVLKKEAGQWKVDGSAKLEAFGLPFDVPIHATKGSTP